MEEPLSPLLPLINILKNCPYAFTAQGLLMVSTILNADVAIQMHISLIRNYTAIQRFLYKNENPTIQEIKQRMGEHDARLAQIYDAMENLLDEKAAQRKWEGRERIGFK